MKKLTSRELEVAYMVSLGKTNKGIAESLCLSPHTVKTVLENIYEKLNLNSRVLLAVYFVKNVEMKD